jgi:AICAR transformylase/IMP cyclohydrolase PurH
MHMLLRHYKHTYTHACTHARTQMEDLKVAWLAVKHVKSNAITMVKDKKLLGMGSGQPNRVNSVCVYLYIYIISASRTHY